jgi:hypothetical protein
MIHDAAAAAAIDQIPESTNATADSHCVTDADVVEALQEGIREAAREEVLINHGEASLYYDALTMSPLNAMSTVSFTPSLDFVLILFPYVYQHSCYNANLLLQGGTRSFPRIQAPGVSSMGSSPRPQACGCPNSSLR